MNMPEIELDTPEIETSGGIKASKLKRPIDREADKIREKTTLPKSPGEEITDKEWEQWARLLTDAMWNKLTMYLYRRRPKIIRQLADPSAKNYIDKMAKTLDLREYIKKCHGGGIFRVEVVSNSGERRVTAVNVDIPIDEADPILNFSELDMNAQENMGYIAYLRSKGIIDDRGKPRQNQNENGAMGVSGADLLTMFDKMTNMVAMMNKEQKEDLRARIAAGGEAGLGGQIGNLLLEKMKQDSPSTMMQSFAAMKDLFVKQGGGVETVMPMFLQLMTQMMTMQSDNHKATVELIKEMKTPKEEGGNLLDSVDSAMSIMERLDSLRGGGGKRGIGDYILEGVEKVGLPLLSHVTRIYEINKLGKSITPNPPIPTTQPAVTGRTISGMEAARNAAKAEQGKLPPKPEEQANPGIPGLAEVDQEMMQLQQVLQGTGGILVQYMNDDRSGADLALWVIEGYKKVTYQMIANAGEDKLFGAIRNFPELWAQLERFGEPAVKTFVHEFCHYEEFLEDEEGVPEPQEERPRGRNKKQ